MRLKRLIKIFRVEERRRESITLGANVRLNPDLHLLQLIADEDTGFYSTDDDLEAKLWVFNPSKAIQWLGFQADYANVSVDGQVVTSVRFRLNDGTDDYWWDGGAWDNAPAAGEWNTEAEIAGNISTFPITDKKLQVIVNLRTTNKKYTPVFREARVLYSSIVEFQEDLIYRSLVPLLRDQIRVKGRYPFTLSADADPTVDIKNDYPIETPYNVRSVDGVFNHTDDPDHLNDLYQSANIVYDAQGNLTTFTITLSGSVPAGKVLWVDFLWEPEVAVTTSQDYSEVEKVPSLVLDDINLLESSEAGPGEWIVNKADGSAVKLPPAIRGNLEILMHLITDKGVDQMRFADEVKRFFRNNTRMTAVGVDEEYDLWLMEEYDMTTAANRGDIHTGRMRFQIKEVRFWSGDAVDAFAVEQFS
jgi:hypothetical protein